MSEGESASPSSSPPSSQRPPVIDDEEDDAEDEDDMTLDDVFPQPTLPQASEGFLESSSDEEVDDDDEDECDRDESVSISADDGRTVSACLSPAGSDTGFESEDDDDEIIETDSDQETREGSQPPQHTTAEDLLERVRDTTGRAEVLESLLGADSFRRPGANRAAVLAIFGIDIDSPFDGSLCMKTSISKIREQYSSLFVEIARLEIDFANAHLASSGGGAERLSPFMSTQHAFSSLSSSSFNLSAKRHRLDALRKCAESVLTMHRVAPFTNRPTRKRRRHDSGGEEGDEEEEEGPLEDWEPTAMDEDLERTFSRNVMDPKNVATCFFHYLMQISGKQNLRRLVNIKSSEETELYAPRIINGYQTVSYKSAGSLGNWVSEHLRLDANPEFRDFWKTMTNRENMCKMISKTIDVRMPNYVVDYTIHGFENCYVDVFNNEAFFYEDVPKGVSSHVARQHHEGVSLERSWFQPPPLSSFTPSPTSANEWTFHKKTHQNPNAHEKFSQLETPDPDDAASVRRYNDLNPSWEMAFSMRKYERAGIREPFPAPPLHIEVPAMARILRNQDFTGQEVFFLFAMIGRLMLHIGAHDTFGVVLWLHGKTNSGKSKILEAILTACFPDQSTFAVLSSNKEAVFGLGPMVGKDVVVCDEVEKRPRWNLGELKTMATGGWMAVSVKWGDPRQLRWYAPCVMSSNFILPEWSVASNDVYAIVRRMAPFRLPNTVHVVDDSIEPQLKVKERGPIFALALACYHYMVKHIGRSSFDSIAPPGCLSMIRDMIEEVHPFVRFLNCHDVVRTGPAAGPNAEMTLSDLQTLYSDWKRDMQEKGQDIGGGGAATRWVEGFYTQPLSNAGCKIFDRIKHESTDAQCMERIVRHIARATDMPTNGAAAAVSVAVEAASLSGDW